MSVRPPRNPHHEETVRASFARQRLMESIAARLLRVAPGEVDIAMPFADSLTQQHGYLHAGIVTALADTACGYAAQTLMEAGAGVVSVEFKINLLSPAVGDEIIARGRVLRHGRTITVCSADAVALRDRQEYPVAVMQATMMAIHGRDERSA
jgi:uncharacterized protein (TIGR00369 family)